MSSSQNPEPPKSIFSSPFAPSQTQNAQNTSNPLNPSSGTTTTNPQGNIFGASMVLPLSVQSQLKLSPTAKTTNSLFGNTSTPATGGSIFGNTSNTSNTSNNATTTSSNTPSGGLFGGGIFGKQPTNPTTSAAPATTSTTPSLFGGGPATTSSTTPAGNTQSIFGNAGAPKPAGSLFGGTNTTSGTTSAFGNTSSTTPAGGSLFGGGGSNPLSGNKPADSSASNAPKPSLFGNIATSATPSTAGTSTAPAAGIGLFGLPPKPAEGTAAPASGSTAQPAAGTPSTSTGAGGTTTGTTTGTSLFSGGLFGKSASSTTPAPASTTGTTPTAPAGGLFGSKPEEKKDGAPAPASATSGFSLFGAKKDTPAASTSTSTATAKPGEKPATPTAGAATASVAVPPPSMLRGKTLEEIVNRWSSDLETHVREFNRFAAEVAVWDRALIENGNNLTALYSHITAAERQQDNIDQSLSHIEQQQKDLAATLDAYEKMSQELLGGQGGGLRTLDTGPADTERDKNYMLATDLHTQLDDLSGSLTQMIDAVNVLSVSNKPNGESNDDPMTQISQILSSHLESLQWIDGAVREVEGKVTDIERRVKDSGYSLTGSTNQGKSRVFGLNR